MEDGSERHGTCRLQKNNYSQLNKEGLSLVSGVTKFHQYIYGMNFVLITDHRPIMVLFNEQRPISAQVSALLQRWALTLAGHDYIIRHRSGDVHEKCDALSHLPLPTQHGKTSAPAEYVQPIEQLDNSPVT